MRARNKDRKKRTRPSEKEPFQFNNVVARQNCEPGQWRALVSIERRWNPPHPAAAFAEFILFDFAVLNQTVWWIGNNSFDAVGLSGGQPLKAIAVDQRRIPETESLTRRNGS